VATVRSGPSATRPALDALARSQPESNAWLTLVAATLEAGADPAWQNAAASATLVPDHAMPVPVLTGATIALSRKTVDTLLRRLLSLAAAAGGVEAPAQHAAARSGAFDALVLLETTINQDHDRLARHATALALDPEGFAPIAQLASMPLLQACRARYAAAVPRDWDAGYCPICAAWPAVAEYRGLERARRLRCGRCGGDWGAIALSCPYCGITDHQQLGSLIPADGGESRKVETCDACHGYIKSLATLRPWPGDEVGLADLGSIELDLVALEHGFHRPATSAVSLDLRLIDAGSPPRGS